MKKETFTLLYIYIELTRRIVVEKRRDEEMKR